MQTVRTQRPTDIRNVTLQRELRALYVEDVMEILGIGQSKAYQIMRRINKELEAEGFETIAGRVSEARFREKFYYKPESIPVKPKGGVRTNGTKSAVSTI